MLTHLRKLQLSGFIFKQRTWLPLWTALSGLEEVQLECMSFEPEDDFPPIPSNDFEQAFRALKRMHTLALKYCMGDLHPMLLLLHHAASLTQLNIVNYKEDAISQLPPDISLQRLMECLPALELHWNLRLE